jgi:hypothetical protein
VSALTKYEFVVPSSNFGEGWLTNAAADLCKIAIAFGGFDPAEIVVTIHKLQKDKSAKANVTTASKALQLIYEAHETPEELALREKAFKALMEKINVKA